MESPWEFSIPQMFVAGIVPGLFLAGLLIVVNMIIAIRNPEILRHRGTAFSIREVLKNTWSALGALLLPVIILGGIYSGIFTPTESGGRGRGLCAFCGNFCIQGNSDFRYSKGPGKINGN